MADDERFEIESIDLFTGDVALDHAGVTGPLLHIPADTVEAL
ncbi:hypothetical protein RISK_000163 [Rhodopirellula islandica]|uniref:Uncharacterized protein n=1 Tax=Rhodopirellula islandica TaxID=595434 RepID=A0A0J1BMS9_RHOIS|nr:hypothetical protein [Rhodopirellula islandica]KLU07790.1 hypothetical protein RISK_000163 [Rhodopirellula islandica]